MIWSGIISLLLACSHGLEDVVKKLLLYDNLNINCLNKKNETCFNISLANKNVIIYNLILNHLNQNKDKKQEKEEKINNNTNEKKEKKNIKSKKNKIVMVKNISFDILLDSKNYYYSRFGKFIIYLKNWIYWNFFREESEKLIPIMENENKLKEEIHLLNNTINELQKKIEKFESDVNNLYNLIRTIIYY